MAARLILGVKLRYGTYQLNGNGPTAEDRARLEEICRSIAADMGGDSFGARTDPTDTLSWPTTHIVLSYSAFNPNAGLLFDLANVWGPKLEATYGFPVHIDASTD